MINWKALKLILNAEKLMDTLFMNWVSDYKHDAAD